MPNSTHSTQDIAVVSARIYALILSSPRLARRLLPEGLHRSPYEILDYHVVLTLHDPQGMQATFARRQRVRFTQEGVSGVLDHYWGDGVAIAGYATDVGSVEDSFADEGRRHLVIGLPRVMARGEELAFAVERTAFVEFTHDTEWMDTVLDHPVRRLRKRIVFPKARPVRSARLGTGAGSQPLPFFTLDDGRSAVDVEIAKPQAHTRYLISWQW